LIGVVQATEAVKLLLGKGEPLIGRLLTYDALGMRFREVRLRRDPKCPLCGDDATITELIDYVDFCGAPFPGGHDGEGASGGVSNGS
jgi:sulfur-carrier protein adenylyltransferase/sulfurtransferase